MTHRNPHDSSRLTDSLYLFMVSSFSLHLSLSQAKLTTGGFCPPPKPLENKEGQKRPLASNFQNFYRFFLYISSTIYQSDKFLFSLQENLGTYPVNCHHLFTIQKKNNPKQSRKQGAWRTCQKKESNILHGSKSLPEKKMEKYPWFFAEDPLLDGMLATC